MMIIGVVPASAQNKTTLLQRINEIKSQSDIYFWDQYTGLDADSSQINATKRLLLDVNCNRDESVQLSVEEIMPHVKYINIDRGEAKQYFVYIKKTDAAVLTPGNAVKSTVKPSFNETINETASATDNSIQQKAFVPDAFVQRIMETKFFMNVYKLLKSLQAQGQILQFGKLKDVEDFSSLDLILFDMQSQEIITMLSPVNASGNRINVVNGAEDSLDNYPTNMTAVIWYIKK